MTYIDWDPSTKRTYYRYPYRNYGWWGRRRYYGTYRQPVIIQVRQHERMSASDSLHWLMCGFILAVALFVIVAGFMRLAQGV